MVGVGGGAGAWVLSVVLTPWWRGVRSEDMGIMAPGEWPHGDITHHALSPTSPGHRWGLYSEIFSVLTIDGSCCTQVLFGKLLKLLQYCDAFRWRKASLSISSNLFIRSSSGILYFMCMFFLCIFSVFCLWSPSVNASRIELFWNGVDRTVGVAGFSNFNLMEHFEDNWHLDPNIPPTYFILPAHQQSSGESNKVDIGCWMQNSSPLTRVWPMEF